MHDAIMTKEEEAVIKTKITRQPDNVQMQRMGRGCADGENGRGHAHEPAHMLCPSWKEKHRLDSRHEQAGSHHLFAFQEQWC